MKNLRLCLFLLFPVLFAQTPPAAAPAPDATPAPATADSAAPAGPTEEQQAKLIADIRSAALAWEGKLADFTCNRTGRLEARTMEAAKPSVKPSAAKADPKSSSKPVAGGRGAGGSPPANGPIYGPWQMLQMSQDRVLYSDHKESYPSPTGRGPDGPADSGKTTDANETADAGKTAGAGKAAAAARKSVTAPAPLLEPAPIMAFANILKGVFSENARAEFTWKGMAALHGLPVLVFEYRVAKENSTEELSTATSRAIVGYHGTFYADRLTHRILILSLAADVPPDFPQQEVERVFTFGEVVIAGQFNLLPLKCEMQVRTSLDLLRGAKPEGKSPQLLARMTTEYLAYHKFAPSDTPLLLVH